MNKKKKPLYKRWWAWLVLVCLIIGGAGSFGDSEETPETEIVLEKKEDASETTRQSPTSEPAKDVENVMLPLIAETDTVESERETAESEPEIIEDTEQETQPLEPVEGEKDIEAEAPERSMPESEPEPDNSQTVYVSSSGKVHRIPDCGNMKSYTEMTMNEADSYGYDYCKNCW